MICGGLFMEELIKKIKEVQCVTLDIKRDYFEGKDYQYIRTWLEEHDLNRHMPIESKSSGIIIVIESNQLKKVLLQIRGTEKSRIGIFGGGVDNNESSEDTAIRELKEELGLDIKQEQLEYLGRNPHELTYQNGDMVNYLADVFVLKFQEFPFIRLDYESNGVICLDKNSINDYINLKDDNALQIYDYWIDFIYKALDL